MRRLLVPLVLLLALAVPAGAQARRVTLTLQSPAYTVAPYEVRSATTRVPAPAIDGSIVEMHASLVDAHGRMVPMQSVMLHHVVFMDDGTFRAPRRDPAGYCPGDGERFFGTGEEHQALSLPEGYGYPVSAMDTWRIGWMLMNHQARPDAAAIRYRVTIDTDPALKPVTPMWAGVVKCSFDPMFDVPGGQPAGTPYVRTSTLRMPFDGRIVASGAHVHGGALGIDLSEPACGDRLLVRSVPRYGVPSDPVYHVLPVLHEPGPIQMSRTLSQEGIPVRAGTPLRLQARYDGAAPHTRVMGIMHLYVARDPAPAPGACPPLPTDERTIAPALPGRTTPPAVEVPLTGLDADGRARRISAPPGTLERRSGDVDLTVKDFKLGPGNLSVPAGAKVSWRFADPVRHDVTVADGPRGFASPVILHGRWSVRLDHPGTYRLFCSLHPVTMQQRVVVRRAPTPRRPT